MQSVCLRDRESGYSGTAWEWQEFLLLWEEKRVALRLHDDENEKRPQPQRLTETVLAEREVRLQRAEERLRVRLPKSYRDFILATAGEVPSWVAADNVFAFNGLFTPEEMDWLIQTNPELIGLYERQFAGETAVDEDYYQYSADQDCIDSMRVNQFKTLFSCMRTGEELRELLLNPREKTRDGEWEAWDFDVKLGDYVRFPCFAAMVFFFYIQDLSNFDNAWQTAWEPPRYDPYGFSALLFGT